MCKGCVVFRLFDSRLCNLIFLLVLVMIFFMSWVSILCWVLFGCFVGKFISFGFWEKRGVFVIVRLYI